MTAPIRLQLSRAKGFNLQAHSQSINGLGAVNVARPSKWGNPWKVGATTTIMLPRKNVGTLPIEISPTIITPEFAVEQYRLWVRPCVGAIKSDLGGLNLACWCPPGAPCHADVLLELANG